ncbi:unnamed protein product [Aphanomyces euteiches]
MTYDDQLLWSGYLKNTLDGTLLGLQFVLFSSYGSFDTYRVQSRAGNLIVIPLKNTFGLNATDLKPGLQLSREELDEMVAGTIGAPVSDLIWVLCSGHIGIARAMLRYLCLKFGSKPAETDDLELELSSVSLLDYIRSSYRGIPTVDAFERVIQSLGETDGQERLMMSQVLNEVASGKIVSSSSDGGRSPRSRKVVDLLTRFGFLYEDPHNRLQFASNMHLKIWLYSNRTHPIDYMVSDISHDDFVVACVKRMSAFRLHRFAVENTTSTVARERQIQM